MFDWGGTRTETVARAHRRRWTGRSRRVRGQSVAEFALVLPVLVAFLGGIIQFGVLPGAQNTLTQVVRDTGRWAATQPTSPCNTGTTSAGLTGVQALGRQANIIASNSSLIGYTAGEWGAPTDKTDNQPPPDTGPDQAIAQAPNTEGIYVAWANDSQPTTAQSCPPTTNAAVWHVTVRINHAVPVFFPGLQHLPGLGTNGQLVLSSTAQFRMEPAP